GAPRRRRRGAAVAGGPPRGGPRARAARRGRRAHRPRRPGRGRRPGGGRRGAPGRPGALPRRRPGCRGGAARGRAVSAATRARLAALLEEGPLDLAEANLLIAAEGCDGLDMASSLAHVEGLAQAAREGGVVEVLRDAGFRGATEDYDDPR